MYRKALTAAFVGLMATYAFAADGPGSSGAGGSGPGGVIAGVVPGVQIGIGIIIANVAGADSDTKVDSATYTVVPQVSFNSAATSSYIRLVNTSDQSANFDIKVIGGESGINYMPGKTLSLAVAGNASPQFSVVDIRDRIIAAGGADITPQGGDTFVNLYLHSDKAGSGAGFQHVIFNGSTGFFENLSLCSYDATQDYSGVNSRLVNVHTTLLKGYLSKVVIHNPDAVSRVVRGTAYVAETGIRIGTFTVKVAANATSAVDESAIEQLMSFLPTSSQLHINIAFASGDSATYTAKVGHTVTQSASGAVFNLTQICAINPATKATTPVTPSDMR